MTNELREKLGHLYKEAYLNGVDREKNLERWEAKAEVLIQKAVLEGRIDENRTYWWHQQKAATSQGVSKHALDRIAQLKKEEVK